MTRRTDSRPRHEQIAADIRARIMSGELAASAQLPSTAALVAQYASSNATIQRALLLLKDERFVSSKVGKGVYVRDEGPLVVEAAAYFAPSPDGYSYELLDVAEVEPPAEVATGLELPPGEPAVLRHRLLRHDGAPVELSWSYYPGSLASGTPLARRRKIPGGAPQVLADLGHAQWEFVDRLSARMPTIEEVELLDLPTNVPVIRQFRVVSSAAGRPVEASVLVKGGHVYELQYRQGVEE